MARPSALTIAAADLVMMMMGAVTPFYATIERGPNKHAGHEQEAYKEDNEETAGDNAVVSVRSCSVAASLSSRTSVIAPGR